MQTKAATQRILLGQITAAHGIRGEVTLRSFTGAPGAIGNYGPLTNEDGKTSFKIRVVRVTDKGVLARIDGINDRNAAEALRGTRLFVDRARLPEPGAGEFYHADLIGLRAVSPDGLPVGTIVAVENFGAGDLLEIRLEGGMATEYVPFSGVYVPDVDLAAGSAIIVMPVMTGEPEPGETP